MITDDSPQFVYYLPEQNRISIVPEIVHEAFKAYVMERAEKLGIKNLEDVYTDIIYLGVL